MFKRKTVIFQIGKENKIVSEFNENITIFYLKIYIRDRTNIRNFDLYFKENKVKNNSIPLYKFFRNNKDKEVKFYLKVNNDNEKNKLKSINKENINIITQRKNNKEKLKLYEKEIISIKEENNQLINNINRYKENINECVSKENKNKEKYNSIENLLIKQKEEIKLLKNEINEAKIKYKELMNKSVEKENDIKKSQLQYIKSNDNFEIISKNKKTKRCLTIESFNTYYPIQKKIRSNHSIKTINLTTENLKRERNSFDSSNINSSIDYNNNSNQLKISTSNISNIYNDKKINNISNSMNNSCININSNISDINNNSNINISNCNNSNNVNNNKNNTSISNSISNIININNNRYNNIDIKSEKESENDSQNINKVSNTNIDNKKEINSLTVNNNDINKENKNKIVKSNINNIKDINNQINENDLEKINKIKENDNNEINSININSISNINYKNSRNEKIKFKNNNSNEMIDSSNSSKISQIKYQYEIKEHNINNNNLNEINNKSNMINTSKITLDSIDNQTTREEDEIDFNKIINQFKINNKNILILSKESLLNDDSLKVPNLFDKYFTIFKFLSNIEILNYSLINKSNGVFSLYFWMNYLENKINYLNDNYNKLSSRYNSLIEKLITAVSKPNTILSNFSRSGLRVLNSPHYLEIFNKPIDYFTKDNIILFIFKMLFVFIKLYDLNSNMPDNDFISFMLNEIKTKNKKTLREYINNLLDKEMDFSFDTAMKAKNIMKFYNIENIEGSQLSKFDRVSTIIGYVVKDIMSFTGLTIKSNVSAGKNNTGKNNKKIEDDISFNYLKNKIINTCEMIISERIKCENIFKKIKELILKFYNI